MSSKAGLSSVCPQAGVQHGEESRHGDSLSMCFVMLHHQGRKKCVPAGHHSTRCTGRIRGEATVVAAQANRPPADISSGSSSRCPPAVGASYWKTCNAVGPVEAPQWICSPLAPESDLGKNDLGKGTAGLGFPPSDGGGERVFCLMGEVDRNVA